MTSQRVFLLLLCSKYMPSSSSCAVSCKYVFFVDNLSAEEKKKEKKKKKLEIGVVYWQTLGVREERKVKLGSILFTLKIQTMLKLRNTLPLEYFFFSTSVWTGSKVNLGHLFKIILWQIDDLYNGAKLRYDF